MPWSLSCCCILLAAAAARAQVAVPDSAGDLEYFEKKVRPLFFERCFSCHSAKAKKVRGGLRLDSRAGLVQGGDSGPALVPRQPEKSLLVKAIRYQDPNLQMPPGGKLPAGEVALLEEWVRLGAPYPGAADLKSRKDSIDIEAGRLFWSFQAPKSLELPAVQNRAWPKQRVDTFVLAALERRGLSPSPAASRRVLIRRATFDLIGLPPTPEDIASFEEDTRPDAYARLIQRLVSSPDYGERWGRFWLDLVRYCDIPEPWSECKGQPFLYRDWVVEAFNDDMPYDRFVEMQLAADLMSDSRPKDTAALGFLGLSPTYWKELKLDKDVIKTVVAEEWEERIATLGGAIMGLTVACARCHDHKFDPISVRDYYALAGVFASVRAADRFLLPDAEAKAAAVAHEQVRNLEKQLEQLKSRKAESKELQELQARIEKIKSTTPCFDAPLVPGVADASLFVLADGPHRTKLEYKAGVAQDVAVQIRGNPANCGPVVPRRFLEVLSPVAKPFQHGSGRLELAKALVTTAAPLTARVIVNRVWKHHFGAGLVETPSDFGAQGERPSHPELLDDLTARFIANGWSLKWLHREIMLSAVYQQTSSDTVAGKAADPQNRLLWRANRRRLEVEAWRDAMLACAETLSRERGGPPKDLSDATNNRRTLYGIVKRRELNDLLRLYDFPDPTGHSPNRTPTTTPLQQLYALNSPFIQRQAAALARRVKAELPEGDEARIQRAYLLLFGRPATQDQVRLRLDFLAPATDAAWAEYAQGLLMSNEFLFVD
jgi:hypothetical protein